MTMNMASLTFARMVPPMVPSVCRISQGLGRADEGAVDEETYVKVDDLQS